MKQSSISIRVSDIRNSYMNDVQWSEFICWSILRYPEESWVDSDHAIVKAMKAMSAAVKKACHRYLKDVKYADGTPLLRQGGSGSTLSAWLNTDDYGMFDNVEVPQWMANKYRGYALTDRKVRIYVLNKILEIDPNAVVEVESFDMGEHGWDHFVKLNFEYVTEEVSGITVKIQDVLAHFLKQTDTTYICTSMINPNYRQVSSRPQDAITGSLKHKVLTELDGLMYPGTTTPILRNDPEMNNLSVLSAWVNPLPADLYDSIYATWVDNRTELVDPMRKFVLTKLLVRIFILNKLLELNSDSVLHISAFQIPKGVKLEEILTIPFEVK